MVRDTSIEAYITIKENGLLSQRRFQVYECLYKHGPMTANDVIRWYRDQYPDVNQTGFNARFSELQEMGVITEVGEEIDSVSGNRCILWDVTSNLPNEPPKKLSRKERIKRLKSSIRPWIPRPERDGIFRSLDKLA